MSELQREWRFYLDDMISFSEKVIAYTDGFDQVAFAGSELNYDATVRNLELAKRLPMFLMKYAKPIPIFLGG